MLKTHHSFPSARSLSNQTKVRVASRPTGEPLTIAYKIGVGALFLLPLKGGGAVFPVATTYPTPKGDEFVQVYVIDVVTSATW